MKKFIIHSTIFALVLSASHAFGQPVNQPVASEVPGADSISNQADVPATNENTVRAKALTLFFLKQGLGMFAKEKGISPDGSKFPGKDTSKEVQNAYEQLFTANIEEVVNSIVDGKPLPDHITPFFKVYAPLAVSVLNSQSTPVLKAYNFDTITLPKQSIQTVNTELKEFSNNIANQSNNEKSSIIALLSEATKNPQDPAISAIFKDSGSSINTLISNATTNLKGFTKDDLSKVTVSLGGYVNISALVMANSNEGSVAYKDASRNLKNILKTANTLNVALPGISIPQNVQDTAIKGLVNQNGQINSSSSTPIATPTSGATQKGTSPNVSPMPQPK